jgi:hypothetical protein
MHELLAQRLVPQPSMGALVPVGWNGSTSQEQLQCSPIFSVTKHL